MTTYIKFEVDQRSWNVGGSDPDDEWSRDSYDGEVSVVGAKLVKEDSYDILGSEHEFAVGDVCYLVWAQYSTGDTFGRDGGQYELLEVYPSYEVAKEREKVYENLSDRRSENVGQAIGYVPWLGYFESLDFVRVEELVIQ